MSEWFDIDTTADGSYSHDTSSIWTTAATVYLVTVNDALAGFMIVGAGAASLSDVPCHDVHEFFILRKYRRQRIGHQMARQVWGEHPGNWLVRVLNANTPALQFWRAAISSYATEGFREEHRILNGQSWTFFQFASNKDTTAPRRA